MSKFYGMVMGNRGAATRGGSKNSGFKSSAQSYDGSVIVRMSYDCEEKLHVVVETSKYSATYGDVKFHGSLDELNEALELYRKIKSGEVSTTTHRKKSNRQLALERAFN